MNQTAEFCSSFICEASCSVNNWKTKYSSDIKKIKALNVNHILVIEQGRHSFICMNNWIAL